MKTPAGIGCALLTAALMVGCGGDDAVMKDYLALANEMAGIYEKATDAASLAEARRQAENLKKQADDIDARMKNWPADKQRAMRQKYEKDITAAKQRRDLAMKRWQAE